MSVPVIEAIESFQFDKAMQFIWNKIGECDKTINENEVWKLTGETRDAILIQLVTSIRQIACDLLPFLPDTAQKISDQFNVELVQSGNPLFPRLQ
jgi:methionyl-tRNA synthetase